MLKGKNILLGVTGGIACYKSLEICSRLSKKGANIKVIMTDAAREFVTPLSFQTMSSNPVYIDMFKELEHVEVEHIALAKWADLIVIAPASANTIAKLANGFADNMLTTVCLASKAKKLIVPAMNTGMLDNVATVRNIETLIKDGFTVTDTQCDLLACKDVGRGKMLEPEEIVEIMDGLFYEKDFAGKTITVTAGPTREALDPVRFLSNKSTGKMGYAIAKEAYNRGAKAILITGPTSIKAPKVSKVIEVESTFDMFEAVNSVFNETDVLIKAAAPADFTPVEYSENKIKKSPDVMNLELKKTKDILKYLGGIKEDKILVGFAAESTNVEEFAKEKLKKKNLDFIVANNITMESAGFGTDTNIATIYDRDGGSFESGKVTKKELANIILDRIKARSL